MSSQHEETRIPSIDVRSCVKLSHVCAHFVGAKIVLSMINSNSAPNTNLGKSSGVLF